MLIDLHCHSTCSDGSLTPAELVKAAEKRNIDMLSITDHDNMDAYFGLPLVSPVKIIKGVEFSTTWNKCVIHILGLNMSDQCMQLQHVINKQKDARVQRAKVISKRLNRCGLIGGYETISTYKKSWQIGRPDFAQLLVKQGIFKDVQSAFKKILGRGKIGDVKSQWLSLTKIIQAIHSAGGFAILAHPLTYQFTNTKLKRFLYDFTALGGDGIEVINGYQNSDKTAYLIKLSQEFRLKASIGSDFHHNSAWSQLGCTTDHIKNQIDPIWNYF